MAHASPRERFIDATIKKVAEVGMENLRTKQIAAEVEMSEGSLFAYFGSKEDILREAFYEVDRRFSNLLLENSNVRNGTVSKENFGEVATDIWHRMFRYLIDHKDETLFTIRYRYSAYYTPEVRSHRQAYNGSFVKAYAMLDEMFSETENFYRGFLLNYVFELSLSFAEKIIAGHIPDTPQTEERIWHAISRACLYLMAGK